MRFTLNSLFRPVLLTGTLALLLFIVPAFAKEAGATYININNKPQSAKTGTIYVKKVNLDKPGYLVVFSSADLAQDKIIGYTHLISGTEANVPILISSYRLKNHIWLRLFYDDGDQVFDLHDWELRVPGKQANKRLRMTDLDKAFGRPPPLPFGLIARHDVKHPPPPPREGNCGDGICDGQYESPISCSQDCKYPPAPPLPPMVSMITKVEPAATPVENSTHQDSPGDVCIPVEPSWPGGMSYCQGKPDPTPPPSGYKPAETKPYKFLAPDPQPDDSGKSFFDGDAKAAAILAGKATHDILCSSSEPTPYSSGDAFTIKVINALRQLGYLRNGMCGVLVSQKVVDGKVVAVWSARMLEDFKKKNGLPLSPTINQKTLRIIDAQIREVEKRDLVAKNWPCFKYFKPAPEGDGSKAHLAYLYIMTQNVFPEELRVQEESECFNSQSFPAVYTRESPTAETAEGYVCDLGYWPPYGKMCLLRDPASYETRTPPDSDYEVAMIRVHEYAHTIDGSLVRGRSSKKIDTKEFYEISYDMSDSVGVEFYKLRPNINDPEQMRQHFFNYGSGYLYSNDKPDYRTVSEDFATSVETYVLHGRVFRDYIKDKPVLAKKYTWIKEHVFKGREFNTGDLNYASYATDLFESNLWYGPDSMWDYKIE